MSEFNAHDTWRETLSSPLVVGIAGGSGSGKSRISAALETALTPRLVRLQHDSYYRDLSALPPEERRAFNFDHPDALETELLLEHLDRLRAGQPVQIPEYDFSTHTRAPTTRTVRPAPVLLIEGIMVLHEPELRARMDLRIFVDAPPDIRLIRRLKRDLEERGRSPAQTMTQYLETVRPMHRRFVEPSRESAHLIVPWGYTAGAVGSILAALRELSR